MTSLWWRVLLAYALGFAIIFVIWSVLEHSAQQEYSALVTRGTHTTGTVTSYTPANHDDLEYAFTVDGGRFTGGGSFHISGSFQPGQQVAVVYDGGDPRTNCACDPQSQLDSANSLPVAAGLFQGLILPIAYISQRYFRLRAPRGTAASLAPLASASSVGPSTTLVGGQSRTWVRSRLPQWLWTAGTVEYGLTVSPEEAAHRLAATVKPDTFVRGFFPVVGLIGWVDSSRFQLTTRMPLMRNSFDSILEGQIYPAPGGSRIIGKLRTRKAVLVFSAIWTGLAALLSIPAAISVLLNPKSWQPGPPPIFSLLLFPLFGVVLLVVGRFIAHWQERRLLRQLDAVLGIQ